jgi:hypothetical protein
MQIKVVKEIISGTDTAELFVSVRRVTWRGMKVAPSRCKKVERNRAESGEAIGGSYATGNKIEFDQKYQIRKDR